MVRADPLLIEPWGRETLMSRHRVELGQSSGDRVRWGAVRWGALLCVALAVLVFQAGPAAADPCEVPDAGGTVVLPPIGCDYLSPNEVHVIIDGLPPDTTIEFKPIHKDFICYEQGAAACTAAIPIGDGIYTGTTVGATPDGYVEKGSVQALENKCWTAPTLSRGKVYLRSHTEMVVYDLKG